jgi:hypothetical protein
MSAIDISAENCPHDAETSTGKRKLNAFQLSEVEVSSTKLQRTNEYNF